MLIRGSLFELHDYFFMMCTLFQNIPFFNLFVVNSVYESFYEFFFLNLKFDFMKTTNSFIKNACNWDTLMLIVLIKCSI